MNEITKHEKQELAWEGKRVRTTVAQMLMAFAPFYAAFPKVERMKADQVKAYHMMLADLDPNKLARAVIVACQAHEYPTQMITPAAIRKAYENQQRAPSDEWAREAKPDELSPLRDKMFRLPEDEDRAERVARLKRSQRKGEARYG